MCEGERDVNERNERKGTLGGAPRRRSGLAVVLAPEAGSAAASFREGPFGSPLVLLTAHNGVGTSAVHTEIGTDYAAVSKSWCRMAEWQYVPPQRNGSLTAAHHIA